MSDMLHHSTINDVWKILVYTAAQTAVEHASSLSHAKFLLEVNFLHLDLQVLE